MAVIRNISVVFSARTGGFISEVYKATRSMYSMAGAVAAGMGAFNLISGATFGIKNYFVDAVKNASDLNETLSKTKVILGDTAPAAIAMADDLARQFGLVKREVLDAAAGIGGLGKNLGGLSGERLTKFTKDMTMVAIDLSSQMNKSFAESSKAITIGLAGNQSDTLRELGAVITDTTVKAYALANGIVKAKTEMTEDQKVMARAGLIMKQLKDSQGDLARTANEAANQFRKAGGGWENFQTSIGQVLLPAVTLATQGINDLGAHIITVFEGSKGGVTGWADSLTAAVDRVIKSVRYFSAYWEVAQISAAQSLANIILRVTTTATNIKSIAVYIRDTWINAISDLYMNTIQIFENLAENLVRFTKTAGQNFKAMIMGGDYRLVAPRPVFKPLLDGFKDTVTQLPDLAKPAWVDMSGDMAAILAGVEQKEAARKAAQGPAMAAAAAAAGPAAVAGGAAEAKGYQGTAAVTRGSTEAASALARFFNQSGGDAAAKETAANTKQLVELEKKNAESYGYLLRALAEKNETALAIANL